MTWFKVDDTFSDHPKVDELSLAAVGLWTLAGSWSARNLTDGRVTRARVAKFGGTSSEVTELVDAGLWTVDGDGWKFHEWEEYQPTKAETETKRREARERMRKVREKRSNDGATRANVRANTHEHDANAGRTSGEVRDLFGNPVPSRPVPSRTTKTSAPTGDAGSSTGRSASRSKAKAEAPKHPAAGVAKAAYDATGGALKFIAVQGIAKWGIDSKGWTPEAVEAAVLELHRRGKPVTRATMDQLMSGALDRRPAWAMDNDDRMRAAWAQGQDSDGDDPLALAATGWTSHELEA